MVELPEAIVISGQINNSITGKRVASAMANQSPHKFAWYTGDPTQYGAKLAGRTMGMAYPKGNHIVVESDGMTLVFGTFPSFHGVGEARPKKHQLLVEFEDGTAVSTTVQMYGSILCYGEGERASDFQDYDLAKEKTPPLAEEYDEGMFLGLFDGIPEKLSVKALMATEQRIPGLGNGVLQDILFNAGIHPKKKASALTGAQRVGLYHSMRTTLTDMVRLGGRDTEKDLFGNPGGYATILSRNTVGNPCPSCGTLIEKEAYLGGSIYCCRMCQAL